MVFLNPDIVNLGALTLTNVQFVAIDREARRTALEYTDLGPYAAFADVPEQRVSVRIVRRITESEALPIEPGDRVALSLRSAPNLSAAGVRAISATIVISAVESTLSNRGGATQRISAIAISSTGAADPITTTSVNREA